ncbi:MAG: flagellar assembly protein FliW [Syntrophomonadaceae bacterium]|jgi:flagellar assembly factor FliW
MHEVEREKAPVRNSEPSTISFSPGLIAFEKLRYYALSENTYYPYFKWLQSLEKPEVSFLLVDPFFIKSDYSIELNEQIMEELQIERPQDVMIYTIVTVPQTGLKDATTNLVGPLVINWPKKIGRQVIVERGDLAIKYPLLNDSLKKLSCGG